jgi:hypothetical protein
MSLLSSFFASHLIPALETAIVSHEPDVQAAIISELQALAENVSVWVASKSAAAAPAPKV